MDYQFSRYVIHQVESKKIFCKFVKRGRLGTTPLYTCNPHSEAICVFSSEDDAWDYFNRRIESFGPSEVEVLPFSKLDMAY